MALNVSRYLRRIDYEGPVAVSLQTLRGLHRAHLFTVPFENLDIHLGRPIVLEQDRLVNKIVEQRRGGFCYELNGAFAALLRALNFDVTMLSAGVAKTEGGFDPPFDHMTLAVTLEQRWLVDVGFGDSFIEPLLLDERREQIQENGLYRIIVEAGGNPRSASDDETRILERRTDEGVWQPRYCFTLRGYELDDFSPMCDYHQTSPESTFTRKRTCSRASPDGRTTWTGGRLILTAGGTRSERNLTGPAEHANALREYFGIDLAASDVARLI